MPDHNVVAGDCVSSVAAENGFFNYLTVWNANAALKTTRTNPNMLVPGDVVKVPDKKIKKVAVALDKENPFLLDRRKTFLKIVVVDVEDKKPKAVAFKLSAGKSSSAKVDSKGLLEIEIDAKLKAGEATISIAPWKPGKEAAPGKPKKPAPYPPPLVPADFEDKKVTPPVDNLEVAWKLEIGSLEPPSTDRGSLQRLFNLGIGLKTASTPEEISLAVKAYQRKNKLTARDAETGKLADIRASLETAHDK